MASTTRVEKAADSVVSSTRSSFAVIREQILTSINGSTPAVVCKYVKLCIVTVLPLSVVIGLCIKSLLTVDSDIRETQWIERSVRRSQTLGALASSLLNERGLTCQYLSRMDTHDRKLLRQLYDAEQSTNDLLADSKHLLPESLVNISSDLHEFRFITRAPEDNFACSNVTDFYTGLTAPLISESVVPFTSRVGGSFWAAFYAYNALLVAKDNIGLQRVYGSNFFSDTTFQRRTFVAFAKSDGAFDALLNRVTMTLHKPSSSLFDNLSDTYSELVARLEESKALIYTNNQSMGDPIHGATWFNDISNYTDRIVTAMEDLLKRDMITSVWAERQLSQTEFNVTLITVILVLLISPAFTLWYGVQSRHLLLRISTHTERLREQKFQLNIEKNRARLLLCQMLPKQIVSDLEQSKGSSPELFEEATVFFSHIDGFESLVVRCEPFQVVDLLNQLYTKCDNILDQYDAYKVETIGDTYLIASGVPRRNGLKHSSEIATIALHVMMTAEDVILRNGPGKVRLTIGINTGPLVAGVVGEKNKRYCIFGDTVNMASRMMTTGLPSTIQLSPRSAEHLSIYHNGQFNIAPRGEVEIKGKGKIVTHWLLGKKNFAFTVQSESIRSERRACLRPIFPQPTLPMTPNLDEEPMTSDL